MPFYCFLFIECGRTIPGVAKGAVTKRLFITSGTGEKLTGICLYFIRLKTDINITIKNVSEVILPFTQCQISFSTASLFLYASHTVCKLFEGLGIPFSHCMSVFPLSLCIV